MSVLKIVYPPQKYCILHPTMKDEEITYFTESIEEIIANFDEWKKDYIYIPKKNEFIHNDQQQPNLQWLTDWFRL